MKQTCDFCQSEFQWTDEMLTLDLHLRLLGSGLGACCSACGEKMVQIEIRNERLRRRRESAREARDAA